MKKQINCISYNSSIGFCVHYKFLIHFIFFWLLLTSLFSFIHFKLASQDSFLIYPLFLLNIFWLGGLVLTHDICYYLCGNKSECSVQSSFLSSRSKHLITSYSVRQWSHLKSNVSKWNLSSIFPNLLYFKASSSWMEPLFTAASRLEKLGSFWTFLFHLFFHSSI